MSVSITIVNKLPKFVDGVTDKLEDAVREVVKDILVESHDKAPFKDGGLRRQVETSRRGNLHYRASYNVEYARYQEAGGDGRRKVRNYSTAGTGAHFLESSGDNQTKKLANKIRKHSKRVHV